MVETSYEKKWREDKDDEKKNNIKNCLDYFYSRVSNLESQKTILEKENLILNEKLNLSTDIKNIEFKQNKINELEKIIINLEKKLEEMKDEKKQDIIYKLTHKYFKNHECDGHIGFNGDDNCENCRGWDGIGSRCECGNRRVDWNTDDLEDIYAEAY